MVALCLLLPKFQALIFFLSQLLFEAISQMQLVLHCN